jgi:hypothetical protein
MGETTGKSAPVWGQFIEALLPHERGSIV